MALDIEFRDFCPRVCSPLFFCKGNTLHHARGWVKLPLQNIGNPASAVESCEFLYTQIIYDLSIFIDVVSPPKKAFPFEAPYHFAGLRYLPVAAIALCNQSISIW